MLLLAALLAPAVPGNGPVTLPPAARHLTAVAAAHVPVLGGTGPQPAALNAAAHVPVHFERNVGQTDARALYVGRGLDYTLFLTADEAVLRLTSDTVVRSRLLGADPRPAVTGEDVLAGRSSYLRGTRDRWRTGVPQVGRVRYAGVYPGVDLVYYGREGELEYDFAVAPHADPGVIRMAYSGVDGARLDAAGDLLLRAGDEVLTLRRPVAYQDVDGRRRAVDSAYREPVRSAGGVEVGFRLGAYDPAHPLVIDPVVVYSTYLGGRRGDEVNAVDVDAEGNVVVTGTVYSTDFPTASALYPAHAGGGYDAFVAKLSPDGGTLLYATYLGGTGPDFGYAVGFDGAGNALVSGSTWSTDFPSPAGPLPYAGSGDAFVAKLSPSGDALLYAKTLGGSGGQADAPNDMAVDTAGNAYVGGITWSSDFPTYRALQATFGGGSFDGFLTKLAPDGAVVFSTFVGGQEDEWVNGVDVDGLGRMYAAGGTNSPDFPIVNAYQSDPVAPANDPFDAFVLRLGAGGGRLQYSTYLSGGNRDTAFDVAVDDLYRAHVVGETYSPNFPVQTPVQPFAMSPPGYLQPDAFVSRLGPTGTTLQYSTFLGGTSEDAGRSIAVDGARTAWVTGITRSEDWPSVKPVQPYGGGYDGFFARLAPNGSRLLASSHLGGQGHDFPAAVAATASGEVFVAGRTTGGWPVVDAVQPTMTGRDADGFVTRITPTADSVPDVVAFTRVEFPVREDRGYARVQLSRTGSGYGLVWTRLQTADGTATAGSDYTAMTDYGVYWPNGATGNRTFLIPVTDDGITGEPPETVTITIESVSGYAVLGEPDTTTLVIREAPAE